MPVELAVGGTFLAVLLLVIFVDMRVPIEELFMALPVAIVIALIAAGLVAAVFLFGSVEIAP